MTDFNSIKYMIAGDELEGIHWELVTGRVIVGTTNPL